MVGPSRLFARNLALAVALGAVARAGLADDPKPGPEAPKSADRPKPADYALPGEDLPAAFVPKTPRTVADQRRIEATRLYAEARSLEERRQLSQAITVLEKALVGDPDSIPILRRLARLCTALGRTDRAVEYSRRVIAAEPEDTDTIARLVDYYKTRRRDPAKAEGLLKEVLANPKLDRTSAGALLLEFELAKLYAAMQRPDAAADALVKVLDALDGKAGKRLTPTDERRILGNEEAEAFVQFGRIFIEAKRVGPAIRAFRRAAVYDDDNPEIALLLAQCYLLDNRAVDALAQAEKAIRKPPQVRQAYELLAQILVKLKREAEIIPRFEAAAKADPKNVGLQYALVDRYRAAGMNDQADAMLKALVEVRPDLQGFPAVFATLLKEKKTEEMLVLLAKVAGRLGRGDVVGPQVEALIADPAYAEAAIDAGLAMLKATPPRLDRSGWFVLVQVATRAKKPEKLVDLLRWSIRENPDPVVSRELIVTLARLSRYDDAEAEVESLMAKFPEERNPGTLVLLGQIRRLGHKDDAAIAVLREALKGAPNDADVTRELAIALNQKGSTDEAIALLKDALKADPTNLDLIRGVAYVYQVAGRNDDSIAFFKGLVDRFPNNDEVVRFARSNLSTVYTNLGDFARGEAELEALYAKTPDDAGVNNDLGYLYAEQGKNLEKAESMIRKAVAEEPDNHAYLDSLGWVLFKRGKPREAIAPLEKAAERLDDQKVDDATVFEHLGDAYFEAKDRGKARAAWQKAEKIASAAKPPDKRLAEIRKKLGSLKALDPSPSTATGANP